MVKLYNVYMKMWYPSLKRLSRILLGVIVLYAILYFLYVLVLLPLLNPSGWNIGTQQRMIIFLSKFGNSLLLPLVVSILIFYFGIMEKERIQYSIDLNELISEMNYNCRKILELPENAKKKHDNYIKTKIIGWLPKMATYTNWANEQNFHFKYLPTNAYFNFINKGHILDKKYIEIPAGNIANFYDLCIKFNIFIQDVENNDPESIGALPNFIKSKHYKNYLHGNEAYETYYHKGFIGEYEIILNILKEYEDINKNLIEEYTMILKYLE